MEQSTLLTNKQGRHDGTGKRNSHSPHYVIDAEKRIVLVRFEKKLSFTEIRQYAESLRADRSFQSIFSEIADLTDVEDLELDAADFLKLADHTDPFSLKAKRAFVVRNTAQSHAACLHKLLRSERHFGVFHTVEEAENWIRSRPPESEFRGG